MQQKVIGNWKLNDFYSAGIDRKKNDILRKGIFCRIRSVLPVENLQDESILPDILLINT